VALLKEEYKEFSFESFCDNSPINEVKASVLAGLGVKGENSLLINEKYGSFCFIGEIVTDMKIPSIERNPGSCKKCGLCKKKCVNNAICGGEVDEKKCLSAITQRKGELTEAEIALIAETGVVWGCDICQDVCPMNKNIALSPIEEFYKSAKAVYENESDYNKNRAFSWRKIDVIERNLKILCCKKEKNQV
jgi:epoxyqueuosine reductase QueG